jgi:hypothetical protein
MRTFGTVPTVPITVRTPFSEWKRSNSRLCFGTAASALSSSSSPGTYPWPDLLDLIDFAFVLLREERAAEEERTGLAIALRKT